MRPIAQQQTVSLTSGVINSTIMTISEDAVDAAMVLQSMTDLYSDKRLAPLREVSTNAWDAHVAAGQTRPIEVTLPSVLSPNFVVQDWGTGLNWEDLEGIYAKFGRSTKRDSDAQTGMLGFGCKSPLTYCLSFTVVGVKNGVKTIAVVSKGPTGIGEIKMLDEFETDEPNGVTVTIPVPSNDIDTFNNTAREFFKFWRDGVLVNGEPPEMIQPLLELDPDVWIIDNAGPGRRNGRSFIVQGNVPYECTTPDGIPPFVAFVEIGSVSFPPSREALMMDERTESTIKTITEFIKDRLGKVITFQVQSAPNSFEKRRRMLQLAAGMPYSYRHPLLKLRGTQYFPDDKDGWQIVNNTASRIDGITNEYIWNRWDQTYTFIRDFPLKSFATAHKDRARFAGIKQPYIVIPEGCDFPLDGYPGVKWSDIPPLPRQEKIKDVPSQPVAREQTRYSIWEDGRRGEYEKYEGDLPVVYVNNDDILARTLSTFDIAAASIKVNVQKDRFVRLHPGAQDWVSWLADETSRLWKRLTKEDRRTLDAPRWQRLLVRALLDHVGDLKDTHLRRTLSFTQSDRCTRLVGMWDSLQGYWSATSHFPEDARVALVNYRANLNHYNMDWSREILEQYPLLQNFSRDHHLTTFTIPEELLIYMNARYAINKKQAKQATDATTDDTAEAA